MWCNGAAVFVCTLLLLLLWMLWECLVVVLVVLSVLNVQSMASPCLVHGISWGDSETEQCDQLSQWHLFGRGKFLIF